MRFKHILPLFGLLFITVQANAQLISSEFGQNRIQYESYNWQRFESPNFAFSFTNENEDLMKSLVPLAEQAYQEIKSLYEYRVRKKIELILYTDFSDFAQSNVGLVAPSANTGGVTKLLDNKILVYFDGNHQDFKRLIREGVARALINRMLFGSNLQEVVQNSVLMHLPDWFTEGLVAYAVEEWNPEVDDRLREAILSKRYENFLELAEKKPALAGQSLFHYIARNHGTASVSNLLYLTRINRSVESGFLYVFGTSLYTIAGSNWYNYYASRYNQDNKKRLFPVGGELKITQRNKVKVKELTISPNGKMLAYVEHQQGEERVVLTDIEQNSRITILKMGARDHSSEIDENYPLLAWRKNSNELVVIHEKADKPVISYLSVKDGKERKLKSKVIKGLERILSVAVVEGNDLVFSAMEDGYSNIYLYKSGSVKKITNDKWDDLDAIAMNFNGRKGIVFASNRPEPKLEIRGHKELPLAYRDLYFYDLEAKNGSLIQLTNTPLSNEHSPAVANEEELIYLSDANGISNRYLCRLDTIIDYYEQVVVYKDGTTKILPKDSTVAPDAEAVDSSYLQPVYVVKGLSTANTNYSRNILMHALSANDKIADILYRDGGYKLFVRDLKLDRTAEPTKTNYRLILERQAGWVEAPLKEEKKKSEQKKETQKTEKELEEELKRVEKEMKANNQQDTVPPTPSPADTSKVDIDNYLFQSEFDEVKNPTKKDPKDTETNGQPIELVEGENGEIIKKEPKKNPASNIAKNETKLVEYNSDRKTKYKNMFKVDELTFQLDNTPLFWGMDLYLQGYYRFPPLGLLFKTSFTDIFEDYRLEVGARMPINFNGMEYFVTFEDRKHRLDKKFSIYRRGRMDDYILTDTTTNTQEEARGRTIKHMAMAEFKYPLSKFRSVRATAALLSDRVAIIAENFNTLQVPVYNETRLGLRMEYVFDNTINLRLNARKGTRARFFADYFQPVGERVDSSFSLGLGSPTIALGLDARHYISLDNKTVFAFRFAGAASFGQKKMLYSLGGMENWMFPSENENIPLPDGGDFAYQVVSANLRGFQSNIRNGSNFALINAEIRIPVTEYLSRTPPNNVLLRNLQLIGFYDVGTAWQGLSPFSKDNPLNTSVIDPGTGTNSVSPIRVRVNYYRRPIVQGVGFGLRTVFLGYFLRMDYAWGIETGDLKTPRVYLSLGMDF
jgi:hypothetical protein